MAKRAASPGIDRKPSKKARTEDDRPAKRERNPNVQQDENDSDDYEQQGVAGDELSEDEERRFEEDHEAMLKKKIESKRNVQGGIAECGVIQSIEMHNFMCHKFLAFNFGPQVNFIIGHNGSGKSAVLSAITVALGGKANDTGRGSGLKSFIKEGEGVSEVSIQIKNEGEEAYRPNDYGKSIVVTRRFTKEGSSTWKIRGKKSDKAISTKKDEVSSMCDHFNLQVSNPLSVLTQDSARAFLSASAPTDKYKFFLRGTQLSQLSEEYDTCLENITTTTKVLAQKKEALPDLETAFKEASTRFKEASKAREQRHKVDDLKKELAWAHVATKELEMTKKLEQVITLQNRLPRIEARVEESKAEFEAATAEVTRLEGELEDLGDIEHLNIEKTKLQSEIRQNKKSMEEERSEQKKMNATLSAAKTAIIMFDKRIAEETLRLEKDTAEKRAAAEAALAAAKQNVEEAVARLKAIELEQRQLEEEAVRFQTEGNQLDDRMKTARGQVANAQSSIERARNNEANKMAPYGKNISGVLDRIKRMDWVGEPPVGPLGLYIGVRDQKWANLIRNQLSNILTAFALTDARDQERLKRLLSETGNGHLTVIIGTRDIFDYSSGEPPAQYPTMLRAMDVSDPFVLRLCINTASIESTLISPSREEADNMLRAKGGGGLAFTSEGFIVRRYPEGGGSSTRAPQLKRDDLRNGLLTGRDPQSQLRQFQTELAAAQQELQGLDQEMKYKNVEYTKARQAVDTKRNEADKVHGRLKKARAIVEGLVRTANDDTPGSIAGIEQAKQESEDEVANVLAQFRTSEEHIAQINETQKPLQKKMDEIRAEINDFDDKRTKLTHKIEEAVANRVTQNHNRDHYEGLVKTEQDKIKIVQESCDVLEEEFKNWTNKALEYCDRWENPRLVNQIEADLNKTQAALTARERHHGASVEDMTVQVNKAEAALLNAKLDFKNMSKLNKALRMSLITRIAKWQEFRRHIALRCKLVFQYHLANRGYFGKVIFDHVAGTLALKVQTDDQVSNTQGGRDKDPRSLSGGEKSFSTICLLLSLWESIGCPLRCLDEFDVFMDAQNRRISMRMMIDTANASDKKQYVLITPQDMNNVNPGPTVRVHRMTDPERHQGTLAFS